MNNSIYEETLNLIENIDRNLPRTWLLGRDNLMKIKHTLEQAQKQEKLLDLNKECRKLLTELRYNMLLPEYKRVEISFKIDRIEHQIKELENDEN